MIITLSASVALNKWMNLDLPRMESPDGKRVGTQPLHSDEMGQAWQCHVVKDHNTYGRFATIIATEARSRYTMIFPNITAPTQEEFEQMFLERFVSEAVNLMLESRAIEEEDLEAVVHQFMVEDKHFYWFRNTDLSVNGHIADTEIWIRQNDTEHRVTTISDDDSYFLALHINQLRKRTKIAGVKDSFIPVARMVDDVLFRFAKGLSPYNYPDCSPGDFPNPYAIERDERSKKQQPAKQTAKQVTSTKPDELPDNVVCLTTYRNKKS